MVGLRYVAHFIIFSWNTSQLINLWNECNRYDIKFLLFSVEEAVCHNELSVESSYVDMQAVHIGTCS